MCRMEFFLKINKSADQNKAVQGDFFLKINKSACTSIRYTRVRETIRWADHWMQFEKGFGFIFRIYRAGYNVRNVKIEKMRSQGVYLDWWKYKNTLCMPKILIKFWMLFYLAIFCLLTVPDDSWDIFIIWKINSGLVWAARPVLWQKSLGPIMSPFFNVFMAEKWI